MRNRLLLAILVTLLLHAGLWLVVFRQAVFPLRMRVGNGAVVTLWRKPKAAPAVSARPEAPRVEIRKRGITAPAVARAAPVSESERLAAAGDGSLTLGEVLSSGNEPPDYPEEARRRGWEGEVELRLWAGADGKVERVDVTQVSGHPLLDRAALSAAETWKLDPAASGHTFRIPIHFRLD